MCLRIEILLSVLFISIIKYQPTLNLNCQWRVNREYLIVFIQLFTKKKTVYFSTRIQNPSFAIGGIYRMRFEDRLVKCNNTIRLCQKRELNMKNM